MAAYFLRREEGKRVRHTGQAKAHGAALTSVCLYSWHSCTISSSSSTTSEKSGRSSARCALHTHTTAHGEKSTKQQHGQP
jgi:hypothetical protein